MDVSLALSLRWDGCLSQPLSLSLRWDGCLSRPLSPVGWMSLSPSLSGGMNVSRTLSLSLDGYLRKPVGRSASSDVCMRACSRIILASPNGIAEASHPSSPFISKAVVILAGVLGARPGRYSCRLGVVHKSPPSILWRRSRREGGPLSVGSVRMFVGRDGFIVLPMAARKKHPPYQPLNLPSLPSTLRPWSMFGSSRRGSRRMMGVCISNLDEISRR